MLDVTTLEGRTFLDVGCGSGLFSLAAAQLGASRVHSFDYDVQSVACATELRRRYAPPSAWTIERGSVLDSAYLASLGSWDIVYSWGVLHHTGAMWTALGNVVQLVNPGGRLFISIYNDQGVRSKLWTIEKRWYVQNPWLRPLLFAGYLGASVTYIAARDLLVRRQAPWKRFQDDANRGMSWYYDVLDWLGGYPFEVATPAAVDAFFGKRAFSRTRLVTRTSGCNEFVFTAPNTVGAAGSDS
jgi:2-polyprenyl-6-hydroxyphenyl methylase/3-demethylubiquinone-9 3-methyltransferase